MEFCSKCDNMYYIKLTQADGNSLIYYCRNCGNEDNNFNKDNLCILSTQNDMNTDNKQSNVINKYTKLDPTLPRIYNIPCPNPSCPTHRETDPVSPEVIYIRYDKQNLNFVYLCTHCDKTWLSNKNV